MSNIHDDAFRGCLTADLLKSYLSDDPSIVDSPGGPKSLTPLAAATSRGHLDVVRLLLENPIRPADPDALSSLKRTPLFFATSRSPAHNRGAIVRLLLNSGADVDLCFADDGNNTPLMNAIFQLWDKELVHQLVDYGASLTGKNAQGDTAFTLAKMRGMEADLLSRNERISNRDEIINALVALILLIFSYVNNSLIKDVMDGVVSELYGINGFRDQTIVDDMLHKPNSTNIVRGETIAEDTEPESKFRKVVKEDSMAPAADPNPRSQDIVKEELSRRVVAPGVHFPPSTSLPLHPQPMTPESKSGEIARGTTIGKRTEPDSKSGTVVKDSLMVPAVNPNPKSQDLVKEELSRRVASGVHFPASTSLPMNLPPVTPDRKSVETAGGTAISKNMQPESKPGKVIKEDSIPPAVGPKPKWEDLVKESSYREEPGAHFGASMSRPSNLPPMTPERKSVEIAGGTTISKNTQSESKPGKVVQEYLIAKAVDPKPTWANLVQEESSRKVIPRAHFGASTSLPSTLQPMTPDRKSVEIAGGTTIGKNMQPESKPGKVVKEDSTPPAVGPKPTWTDLVKEESSRRVVPGAHFGVSTSPPLNLPKTPERKSVEIARGTTIGKKREPESRSGMVIKEDSITEAMEREPRSKDLVKEESSCRVVISESHFAASTFRTLNLQPMIPEPKSVEIVRDKTIAKSAEPASKSGTLVTENSIVKSVDPNIKSKDLVEGESNTKRVESKPNPEGLGGGLGAGGVQSESESQDSPKETVPEDSPNRISVEELQADLTTYVKETDLEKFFAPGDRFLQDLAKNAAALKDEPLGTPDNIHRLTCLSLCQLVIYCDDSSSMSQHRRYQSQQELVGRIAAIATKIVPDNLGIELRFINAKGFSNMSAAEINNAMASVAPYAGTPIGTNLRKKILEPLVYNVLADPSKKLQRPLLVCAITDGCPTGEHRSLFQRNIVECTRMLNKHGYKPNAVTFCLSQIGDDREAAEFLDGLREDAEIQGVLYCTTDRLDKVYEELKGNEKRLEEWLLKTLTSPIMNRIEV